MKNHLFRKMIVGSVAMLMLAGCATTKPGAAPSTTTAKAKKYSQGVTDTTIKLGQSTGITGAFPQSGLEAKAGVKAYVDYINDQGGINGRKLEITHLDDGFDGARMASNVKRLLDQEKVFAVASPFGSAFVPGTFPDFERTGAILWAPIAPADPSKSVVFSVGTPYEFQAKIMLDYLVEKGFKKMAMLIVDQEVGTRHWKGNNGEGLEKHLPASGITLTDKEIVPVTQADMSAVIQKIKAKNPDVVYAALSSTQVAAAMTEANKLGWKVQFVGSNATVGTQLAISTGKKDVEGAWATLTVASPDSDTPAMKKALEILDKYAPKELNRSPYTFETLGRTMALVEVLKRSGDELTWENFIKQAEGLKNFETGIYPPMNFGPGQHLGTQGAYIAEIKNGKFVKVTDFRQPK